MSKSNIHSLNMVRIVREWIESKGYPTPTDEEIIELVDPLMTEYKEVFKTEFNAYLYSDGMGIRSWDGK